MKKRNDFKIKSRLIDLVNFRCDQIAQPFTSTDERADTEAQPKIFQFI